MPWTYPENFDIYNPGYQTEAIEIMACSYLADILHFLSTFKTDIMESEELDVMFIHIAVNFNNRGAHLDMDIIKDFSNPERYQARKILYQFLK